MFEGARCSALRWQRWALRQHTRALRPHGHGCRCCRTFSAGRPNTTHNPGAFEETPIISDRDKTLYNLKEIMKRNKVSAAAVTAQDGHAKQGPLAMPFGIPNVDKAKVAFESWKDSERRMTFDSSAITVTAIKPVYLPFFAFDANLSATFTGEIGYTEYERVVDSNGKSRSTRRTDWYSSSGMRVGPKRLDPTVNVEMLQYESHRHLVHSRTLLGSTQSRQQAASFNADVRVQSRPTS